MEGPFFAAVAFGLASSLGLVVYFWRAAPGVSVALLGGLAGAFSGFLAWVFVPENLEHVDLLDGGLLWSFGSALPAAARGFTLGLLTMALAATGLARRPKASPRFLRSAAIALLGGGAILGWLVRTLMGSSCRPRPMDYCSHTSMVMWSVIADGIAIALLLLVLAPTGRSEDRSDGPSLERVATESRLSPRSGY